MTNVQSPMISIGMPVYNGEQYLAGAIESILKQSFDNFELIICDNASTDSTENIDRDFVEQDARVHYYRNETHIRRWWGAIFTQPLKNWAVTGGLIAWWDVN